VITAYPSGYAGYT